MSPLIYPEKDFSRIFNDVMVMDMYF